MIRINQVKLPLNHTLEEMATKLAQALRISESQLKSYHIVKQSIDARKKPDVFYSYTVDVTVDEEEWILKRVNNPQISLRKKVKYKFVKKGKRTLDTRPIIVGSGPAGLFAAYLLAMNGYAPILLERGEAVDERAKSVEEFWSTGKLNCNSNVQFGEGGAGTFSDGKLNTLVKDKEGRNKEVLKILVKAGASEKILYDSKPHMGTDVLIDVVKNMRESIISRGGEVRFNSLVTDIILDDNSITGVIVNNKETMLSEVVILAIGHSARDTFQMLHDKKVPMEAKSFAVGLRVEHPQSMINTSQYGQASNQWLGAAAYKLAGRNTDRGVYSFCMCPGGYVVNASSEEGKLAVNGMSYEKRDGNNANSAIIVAVTPEDFTEKGPLAGLAFQRNLEEKAYQLANGKIPVQLLGDFKKNQVSVMKDFKFEPCIKGAYELANLRELMPESMNDVFLEGMTQFGKSIKGFANDETILVGIESRTSSPIRILRDQLLESTIKGLYPCGEGAGYAGGITSAAMDGMKVAETIASIYRPYILK